MKYILKCLNPFYKRMTAGFAIKVTGALVEQGGFYSTLYNAQNL